MMMTARKAVAALALALPGLLLPFHQASAQEKESFSEARFEALQAEGALVLVDVFADWCPTCAAQQEILATFREEHPDVPLHVLTVDFDKQKKWVKHFKAPRQSTFVLFKGGEQVWFAVTETRQEEVFKQILLAAS